jgi:hypothetical protein
VRWAGPLAVAAAVLSGAAWAAPAVADAVELDVVTVQQARAGGAADVVADLHPAPAGALPPDAAVVTAAGAGVASTVAPLLDGAAPVSVVLDASPDGRAGLAQASSGVAGYLLRLPPSTHVSVTVDGGAVGGATATGSPSDAIHALTSVRPGTAAANPPAAVAAAVRALPAGRDRRALVLLETSAPAPGAQAAARMMETLRAAQAVLAVVAVSAPAEGWDDLARATGGLAVGAGAGGPAAAFDEVALVLRARSVVTFTPPPGARQVDLRLRSGDSTVSATVPLAAAPVVAPAGAPAVTSGRPVWPVVLAAVLAVALAVAVAVAVVRRRRRRGAVPPAAADDGSVPPGVRVFDVSDPRGPVEIETSPGDGPATAEPDAPGFDRSA